MTAARDDEDEQLTPVERQIAAALARAVVAELKAELKNENADAEVELVRPVDRARRVSVPGGESTGLETATPGRGANAVPGAVRHRGTR
jgi:hypothetical protein